MRAEADKQLRKVFAQLYDISPSELHGFSIFGTKIRHYSMNKTTDRVIQPARIPSQPDMVTDTTSKERWNLNILDQAVYQKFLEVVEHAKAQSRVERTLHTFMLHIKYN